MSVAEAAGVFRPLCFSAVIIAATGCMVGDPADDSVPDAVFDATLTPDQDIYPVGDVPELESDAPPLDIDSIEVQQLFVEDAMATSPAARAAAAWHALVVQMGDANVPGLYRDHDGSTELAPVWGFSQVFAGALDRAKLTGKYRIVENMRRALVAAYRHHGYYAATAYPNNATDRYWDDNSWIGLDLLQAYEQTHDRRFKHMALNLYRFIRAGFAPDGGVAWRVGQNPPQYGVPATGSATMFAARLYMLTHDARFLRDAEKHYKWMFDNQRWSNGFYHEARSYDDGLGIGAGVLLYRITHEQHYLDDAIQTANATLDHYANGGYWTEWAVFNAIFFRNLLALDAVAPDPRYRAAMQGYLQRAWTQGRDMQTGLFDRGGIRLYGDPAPPPGWADSLDQGGFVQMYALLAWPGRALGQVD